MRLRVEYLSNQDRSRGEMIAFARRLGDRRGLPLVIWSETWQYGCNRVATNTLANTSRFWVDYFDIVKWLVKLNDVAKIADSFPLIWGKGNWNGANQPGQLFHKTLPLVPTCTQMCDLVFCGIMAIKHNYIPRHGFDLGKTKLIMSKPHIPRDVK